MQIAQLLQRACETAVLSEATVGDFINRECLAEAGSREGGGVRVEVVSVREGVGSEGWVWVWGKIRGMAEGGGKEDGKERGGEEKIDGSAK